MEMAGTFDFGQLTRMALALNLARRVEGHHQRFMIRAAFRFCAVGAFVAALDFGALWILQQFLPRLIAVSIAYFIGVATHFGLNKWWVFGAGRQVHATEVARYVIMVVACWLCTVVVAWAALKFITPNVLWAKVLSVPPAAALAFVMMRRFVFRAN